jgi:hypothetical protein
VPERKFKMYQSGNQKGIAKNDRQHQSLKKKKRRTTDNTITKEKEQTMIYKTIHIKLKIEPH